MAHWTGVEPVTYRLEIGCSIQLSYRCAFETEFTEIPLIPRSLVIQYI